MQPAETAWPVIEDALERYSTERRRGFQRRTVAAAR
jgi:hypothetical protein